MSVRIPMRPEGLVTPLTEAEKDCLTWFVLSSCKKEDAYAMFVNPSVRVSKPAWKKATELLFDSVEAIQYMDAYKSTLELSMNPSHKPAEMSDEERRRRKMDAIDKLMNFVIQKANNIENVENPEDVIKYAEKLGLLESEEEKVIAPMRYLPVSCSECQYKRFVEENCVIEKD